MSNILDTIQVSGASYDLKDKNAPSVSSLTQSEYDNLPSTAKTSNTFFVITDAQAGDLTNYYTKTETNTLLGGKADTATTYTKTEVDNAITGATSTKQDTLVSGTNIKTINNTSLLGSGNIDIQGGGGGGKSVTGGTNISITTGETADTINCTLPITAGTNSEGKGIIVGDSECSASGRYGIAIGHNSDANGMYSFCNGSNSNSNGSMSFAYGSNCNANQDNTFAFGNSQTTTKINQFIVGQYSKPKNEFEVNFGTYNNSVSASTEFGHSGNTLFAIGNGYDFSSTHNWHNALEIRQNGDIYIPNTNDTSVTGDKAYSLYPMIKLQDHLGGGGASYSAGRGIAITTGETADTVSFNLPISAGTGINSIIEGKENNIASGGYGHAEGYGTMATSQYSHSEGLQTSATSVSSHAEGCRTKTTNSSEHASGQYNVSSKASTTFGDSGNTLFSVGNGTSNSARHNAFEIRQNGDIYLSSGGTDIKLQDHLGGGGSSYTAGDGIDITNDVISVTGKADTSAVTAVQDSLSGYVYTADNGKQDIFGAKTFIGAKRISFTQAGSNDKLGFTLYDVRDGQGNAKEFGALELNPTGITENSVTHPLLTLNHYRNDSGRDVQTYLGYRQYDTPNRAAYHLLAPLPENAKTPFNLTTTFQNYYFPLGFKNGSTMIKADNTGVVNLSSELGGLKLVKLTQIEYDNLATKDSNTLYVIVN